MKVLVTGHCGFIGTQVWNKLRDLGHDVYGLDDLSRSTSRHLADPRSYIGDVVDIRRIRVLDQDFDWVVHLAGQVSVVASEVDPDRDFHTNARGTFEVVQWAKERSARVIYSSTNKVFGELEGVSTPIEDAHQWHPQTNYGVSKATGAAYVQDYPLGWVLHQSCIYGPTQLGEVDQGWIGWLRQSVETGRPIVCFGDGTQVRDLLHVDDLVDLYVRILSGDVPPGGYVVGGGPENQVSFTEAVEALGGKIAEFGDWRPHDQRYFVSANEGLLRFGWAPKMSKDTGLRP